MGRSLHMRLKDHVSAAAAAAQQHPVAAGVALVALWPLGTVLLALLAFLAPFIGVGAALAVVGVLATRGTKPAAAAAKPQADPAPKAAKAAAKPEAATADKPKAPAPAAAAPAAPAPKPAQAAGASATQPDCIRQ